MEKNKGYLEEIAEKPINCYLDEATASVDVETSVYSECPRNAN